jgi:hypothetical protein
MSQGLGERREPLEQCEKAIDGILAELRKEREALGELMEAQMGLEQRRSGILSELELEMARFMGRLRSEAIRGLLFGFAIGAIATLASQFFWEWVSG